MDINKQAQETLNLLQIKESVEMCKTKLPVIMEYLKTIYNEAIKTEFDKKQAFELTKMYWSEIMKNL